MASVFQPVADRLNRLKKQLLYQNQQVNQLTYFTEADNHNRLSVYQIKNHQRQYYTVNRFKLLKTFQSRIRWQEKESHLISNHKNMVVFFKVIL